MTKLETALLAEEACTRLQAGPYAPMMIEALCHASRILGEVRLAASLAARTGLSDEVVDRLINAVVLDQVS